MSRCPCCSDKDYSDCCKPYIDELKLPEYPEQLMRSRYTAYTKALTDYIADTMCGKAAIGFDKLSSAKWAQSVVWFKLEVLHVDNDSEQHGVVEFSATFAKNNKLYEIHELSEFIQDKGKWYYTDGKQLPPIQKFATRIIPLNSPCPCGSGRKYKSCHRV